MRAYLAVFAALFLALAGTAGAEEHVLNVYDRADYIDSVVIERFTRETGTKVLYDTYDSLETLEGKLLAGNSGYDIVVPTSEPTFSRLIRAGALQPLDKAAVAYVAPREFAQLWFDMLAIPKDAPHAADANKFINFLLQPAIMAAITNKVGYPNAIPASRPFIEPSILANPNIYPPPEAQS